MIYCEGSIQANLRYSFKDKNTKLISFKGVPIEINTGNFYHPDYSEYNPQGFKISFYSTNNGVVVSYIVKGYRIEILQNNLKGAIYFLLCNDTLGNTNIDPETLSIDYSINCGTPPQVETAYIEVFYQGQRIYFDEGLAPLNYFVSCDNDCPKGFMRCETDSYPGFKCVNCEEFLAETRAIKSIVRSMKK